MFSIRCLRLYFPSLEPWVVWSASLLCHSFLFIYVRMWGHRVCQPPPCGVCQLQPGLPHSTIRHLTGSASHHLAHPSPPATTFPRVLSSQLPISAPPTGLDEFISLVVGLPYSSIFCQFWLFFVFKLLLSFWLCEEAQCVYLCIHLGRKSSFKKYLMSACYVPDSIPRTWIHQCTI